MRVNRTGSHTVTRLTVHLVFLARTNPQQGPGRWATKYRYHVLVGEIKPRCRDLLIQICDAGDVQILKGVVSQDHVHLYLEYEPSISISDLVKRLKGRTWRLLQREYPQLEKRYWGRHFWGVG